MHDAYELAEAFLDDAMSVTCIPVYNHDDELDVAIVALEPNAFALLSLLHPSSAVRVRAMIAVAGRAHELLPERGLRYADDLRH
jgi:hypothetical protein